MKHYSEYVRCKMKKEKYLNIVKSFIGKLIAKQVLLKLIAKQVLLNVSHLRR